MEAIHRDAIAWEALAEGLDGITGFQVDTRHTDAHYTSFTSPCNNLLQVACKLFAIKMAMRVNHLKSKVS
jgi:hypothetical protein